MQYKDIPPKITAEAFMSDSKGELNDYKILCFNGKPQFIWIDQGRYTHRTENIYDTKWNLQPFLLTYENSKEEVLYSVFLNSNIQGQTHVFIMSSKTDSQTHVKDAHNASVAYYTARNGLCPSFFFKNFKRGYKKSFFRLFTAPSFF